MSRKAGDIYFGDALGPAAPDPGHCFPSWQVPNLSLFHRDAVAGGVECLQAPKEDVFGWVAYYRDPDGLLFSVVQPKPTANSHGIVLSGGGALGSFELGVLQVLARKGLPPPSVITGTSVGGFNAAVIACELGDGKSVAEAVDTISQIWLKNIAGGYHDNGVFRFRYDMKRPFAPSVSTGKAIGEMLATPASLPVIPSSASCTWPPPMDRSENASRRWWMSAPLFPPNHSADWWIASRFQ